jgi:N utilization substance protein B
MASIRDIRRLAFQALFQIDARGGDDLDDIRASLAAESDGLAPDEIDRAIEWATGAYAARAGADREFEGLAPTWPAHRLAAVDRAILRLAHFEMTTGRTAPKVAVNEAIELAKHYSTDRSPAFINGLLDKVLKRVQAASVQAPSPAPPET